MVVVSEPAADIGEGPVGELSARDAEILAFERQWWKFAGAKEQAIRDKFQMSATRYYQVLNALIDKPEALAHDPLLVKRLRRLRATPAAEPVGQAARHRPQPRRLIGTAARHRSRSDCVLPDTICSTIGRSSDRATIQGTD